MMKPTRRDYCQFLISTQTNYTQTYFADHHPHFSHDAINRYLQDDNITPAIVWEQIQKSVEYDPDAFLLFDDSVSDKNHSHAIELVRRQYSGNAHGLIKGIGVVNCLYVNPKSGRYWIIDWRVFAPQADQKTKLQHVQEMFDDAMAGKKLPFRVVLMDSWYATKELMVHVHRAGKIFTARSRAIVSSMTARHRLPTKPSVDCSGAIKVRLTASSSRCISFQAPSRSSYFGWRQKTVARNGS